MASFTLKDDGYPWRVVYQNRKAVGRVYPHAAGGWRGKIGPHEAAGSTAEVAFREVAARALGYGSAAELHARNSIARRQKNAHRRAWNAVADAYLGQPVEGQMALLDRLETPGQLAGFMGGVSRRIFR